ncbi:MAG TPA: DNA repair protein RecN [Trueperaceae bacterium]|nr:DNA repair protein RecN [Trueperaceae bacterium]
MLRRLELRDFAIIDELGLDLAPGLNVLSGETGAGKSIVIDALELLAGARADVGLVRAGAESALVQGEFAGSALTSAARRLAVNGRHSARVDGELVAVSELSERCGEQIAVFAQHGTLELQTPSAQRAQLDRLLPEPALATLQQYRLDFQRLSRVRELLGEVETAKRERARRLDVLDFQIEEIDTLKPRVGEDAELGAELEVLRNAERILLGSSHALEALNGEETSASALTATALRELRSALRYAPSLGPLADDLDAALTALTAVASEVEAFIQGFDADPARLDAVQARLAALENLRRKYGDDLVEVLAFRDTAKGERAKLRALDEDEAELRTEAESLTASLAAAGEQLSAARRTAGERLEREVAPLLRRLGMPDATFSVAVLPAARPAVSGLDDVEFRFGANPGEPPGPLAQIASGGELSRLMLAMHLVTGAEQSTLAFDEIDAGVGGRAAHDVGALLGALARDRQVLVVTHLAQVAAFAGTHFVVSKDVQGGRTLTEVRRLSDEERPGELARMLSGSVTDASLEHAAELLAAAGSVATP